MVLACEELRGSRGEVLEHASLRCGGVKGSVPHAAVLLLLGSGVV